jgi:hypothetical protein
MVPSNPNQLEDLFFKILIFKCLFTFFAILFERYFNPRYRALQEHQLLTLASAEQEDIEFKETFFDYLEIKEEPIQLFHTNITHSYPHLLRRRHTYTFSDSIDIKDHPHNSVNHLKQH